MIKNVVILGNDHTNSLGLIQSIGILGIQVYAFVWGQKKGIVKSSKYLSHLYSASSPQKCIEKMVEVFKDYPDTIPVLCACDTAAITLEQNSNILKPKFKFEYSGNYKITQLQEKNLQVKLAEEAGFKIPKSFKISKIEDLDNGIPFSGPYLYKALKSIEGSKADLTICQTENEIRQKVYSTLQKTPRVLIQQYIEHDYEISILGCNLRDGRCIIPAVENKLTIFPKNVGLECLAEIRPLIDSDIITPIKNMLATIGYVGLFSVEMMHSKSTDKFYFTEINLRNDGANSFIRKYGINLPAIHIKDLMGELTEDDLVFEKTNPGYYIWEMHHIKSLMHGDISFIKWLKEIIKARGGLVLEKKDFKPFIMQFLYPIISKITKSAKNY